MERLKPTPEMLEAVEQSMRSLLNSGTPDHGVAIILWNMISWHVQLILKDKKNIGV
jgi:hypothetical protein